jgi:hypothetical protein
MESKWGPHGERELRGRPAPGLAGLACGCRRRVLLMNWDELTRSTGAISGRSASGPSSVVQNCSGQSRSTDHATAPHPPRCAAVRPATAVSVLLGHNPNRRRAQATAADWHQVGNKIRYRAPATPAHWQPCAGGPQVPRHPHGRPKHHASTAGEVMDLVTFMTA